MTEDCRGGQSLYDQLSKRNEAFYVRLNDDEKTVAWWMFFKASVESSAARGGNLDVLDARLKFDLLN